MRQTVNHSSRRTARLALALAGGLLGLSIGADAIASMDYDSYLVFKKRIRFDSDLAIAAGGDRESIRRQEDEQINILWEEYLDKAGYALSTIGGMSINGVIAATINSVEENGASALLGFNWIDPLTRQPAPGLLISSVQYFVNRDPSNDSWEFLGASSNPSNNFLLSTITGGFEPDYQAIPLDAAGQPIFLANAEGFNMAFGTMTIIPFSVPAPGAPALAAISILPLLRRRRS